MSDPGFAVFSFTSLVSSSLIAFSCVLLVFSYKFVFVNFVGVISAAASSCLTWWTGSKAPW